MGRPGAEPVPASNEVAPFDVNALAALANQFFSALPGETPSPSLGGVPAPTNPLPGGAPTVPLSPPSPDAARHASSLPGAALPGANIAPAQPQSVLNLGASSPSLLPHAAAPNGLPDHAAIVPPAIDGRFGGVTLGVPEAYAASLPLGFVERNPSSASPYYFLDPPSSQDQGGGRYYFSEQRSAGPAGFDVHAIRRDFPILQERVNGKPLVWFDNAATTQKPKVVIDRVSYFYEHENSNIHRAAHELAARATDAYENARNIVTRFIGAGSPDEIIFVRGTTEAINLIAKTWGAANVGRGDEIIVSNLEHHANIVPWQQLCEANGAKLRVIPVDDTGQVRLDEYAKLLNERTRLVSVTQVSNALGTVVPVQQIVAMAHAAGAKALVDGAQSVSHLKVDVRALDADFFVFSGHKIFGPTGIGVVYGKRALLEQMPPWQGGGNMIADVTFERTVFQPPPNKFEAGTGNIADAVGLGAALEYVERLGLPAIAAYEHDLLVYATHGLQTVPGIRLVGTAAEKASVLSFVLPGWQTEEIGRALNEEGIAVRSGHHCAQPILRRFGLEATVRPSLAFYNTCEEVDLLVRVVDRLARSRR